MWLMCRHAYFGSSGAKVAVFWSGLGNVWGDFGRGDVIKGYVFGLFWAMFVSVDGERGGLIRELWMLGNVGEGFGCQMLIAP